MSESDRSVTDELHELPNPDTVPDVGVLDKEPDVHVLDRKSNVDCHDVAHTKSQADDR